jgi:hypothetical protein
MSTTTSPAAERLADAGQHLHEQLLRFVADIQSPTQALPLGELLATFDTYMQVVLSCLPPVLSWQHNPSPTPAELLAEREQSPLYRLGWVRGYKQGQAASQRLTPITPEVLIQRVQSLVTQMQQRYGTGPVAMPFSALK